ncbi:hypothetical protein [Pantoea stewartii]|uniref:hypothetical protein n=1 Tax=Pantoea stewartii TaxID=66269 RepID=UPI0012ECAC0B|nr:hypothetical protein [Pantoea stewartii]
MINRTKGQSSRREACCRPRASKTITKAFYSPEGKKKVIPSQGVRMNLHVV